MPNHEIYAGTSEHLVPRGFTPDELKSPEVVERLRLIKKVTDKLIFLSTDQLREIDERYTMLDPGDDC